MVGASGKLVCSMASGSIAGPFLVGLAMQRLGRAGVPGLHGGGVRRLGLFAVYRMSRRAPPVQAEGAEMPQMAPTTTLVGATVIAEELTPSPEENGEQHGEPNVNAFRSTVHP
jgi:hypothetical protein